MLKRLLLLLSMVIWPSLLLAQNVTVTGTITDNNSTIYAGGTMTVTLVNTTGQQATFGGSPAFQKVYSVTLDNTGSFSISLPPNSTASPSIQPAGTQWNFAYTSIGNYGAANANVTITGSGSISGSLSALTRITWPFNATPPPCSTGQTYVSLGSGNNGCGSSGGSGTINSCATTNAVAQYTAATTVGCGNADFTIDATAHTLAAGAAGLVDMSAETGSNAFKIPVGAGCTASNNGAMCFNTTTGSLTVAGNPQIHLSAIPGTNCLLMNASASGAVAACANQLLTSAFCKANGTAANPSVVSCGANPAGMISCATNASTGTCQVNTTIVTANSQIFITQNAADGGASQLNVTCNTASTLPGAAPILASKSAGASFTLNMGTITTNPACFEYIIVN